jgi:ABC-2 type transport system permease protein
MNWRIVSTLVRKDVTLFFRDRFFAFITVLALVFYGALYFLLPRSIDEMLEIALYAPTIPPIFGDQTQAQGLVVREMASEEALKEALAEGEYTVGVVLSADFLERLTTGRQDRVDVYFNSDFPEDLQQAYTILFQELAYMMGGTPLNIEISEEVLGPDMAGMQIPPRDRMRPVFAVFILVMETLGLASLISAEVEAGTLQALMITPMRIEGLFLGKGITGVSLAFGQAALLMAVTGGLSQRPFLILLTLFLGAVLVTGIGFMMASVAKDLLSVSAWGVLAFLVLSIPAFSVLFPGTISDWIKIIPSYYLVDTVHRVANFNVGWRAVWQNLVILVGFAAVFLGLGIFALRRKFR